MAINRSTTGPWGWRIFLGFLVLVISAALLLLSYAINRSIDFSTRYHLMVRSEGVGTRRPEVIGGQAASFTGSATEGQEKATQNAVR